MRRQRSTTVAGKARNMRHWGKMTSDGLNKWVDSTLLEQAYLLPDLNRPPKSLVTIASLALPALPPAAKP